MKTYDFRGWIPAVLILIVAIPLMLWSWNTLAELFGLPTAQIRHALAACFGMLAVRWGLFPGRFDSHGFSGKRHVEQIHQDPAA